MGPLAGPLALAGTVRPGIGTGTLTAGPLAMADGARIEWQIETWSATPGSGQDLLAAESLDLAGNIIVVVDAAAVVDFSDESAEFTLVSTTSGITGFETTTFAVDASSLPAADGHWNVITSGGELRLSYTPLTPFERWQLVKFTTRASDPLVAGEFADPDRDGISNFMEYALGTEPELAGPTGITQDMVENEGEMFLRLTIPRNPDATDLTYTVQTSSDLTDPDGWTDLETIVETDLPELLVVRDALGGPMRFMRLRVSR